MIDTQHSSQDVESLYNRTLAAQGGRLLPPCVEPPEGLSWTIRFTCPREDEFRRLRRNCVLLTIAWLLMSLAFLLGLLERLSRCG